MKTKLTILALILLVGLPKAFAGGPVQQTFECTFIPTKDLSQRLSVEIRDGKIYRFDYTQIRQPGDKSCSVSSFRAGRESEWQDKGNITTAPHLVGKGGQAGQAILENQTETIKIQFINLDPAYYCETPSALAEEIVLSKKSQRCLSVQSAGSTKGNKKN